MDFETKFKLQKEMSHDARYTAIVNGLGYNSVKQFVPFSVAKLKTAYNKGDIHFNSLPLSRWDRAAEDRLSQLVRHYSITSFSLSELVCILKRCAMMMIEEEEL